MTRILPCDQRDALLAGYATGDWFGPGGDDPYVAIALAGTPAADGAVLQRLPCPVIGIGTGPLAAWCDLVLPDEGALAPIAANIAARPRAATVLVQVLRATGPLAASAALMVESLAYATLQTGAEFRRWRETTPAAPPRPAEGGPAVIVERTGDTLRLLLNRAGGYNAIDVAMRDALVEALQIAAIDRTVAAVSIAGNGRCFSIGGDVGEFGNTVDPSEAHVIRSVRSPAMLLAQVAPRLTARLHGAVIGAGVELAAFAGHVVAERGAWFQLPELRYGLIPGAGGTVSLPRRIGRQRTAYLALSGRRIPAETALAWGLVDELA